MKRKYCFKKVCRKELLWCCQKVYLNYLSETYGHTNERLHQFAPGLVKQFPVWLKRDQLVTLQSVAFWVISRFFRRRKRKQHVRRKIFD